jgi:hypothetical protein
MDRQSLYLEMYKEWRSHVRHHETQRSAVTAVSLTFAGAAASYLLAHWSDIEGPTPKLPLLGTSISLLIIGVIVCVLNQKQYERIRNCLTMANELAKEIDKIGSSDSGVRPQVVALRMQAFDVHKGTFKCLPALRLHHVWFSLPAIVLAFGLFCTCKILWAQPCYLLSGICVAAAAFSVSYVILRDKTQKQREPY